MENVEDKPKELSMIDKAELAAKKLNEASERMEKANARAEEILARQLLSGRAEAGQPSQKIEETPKEYTKRIMGGGKP
jgi:hypothetical protein